MSDERAVPDGHQNGSGPLVIGVAGGSGSGKTTVVRRIVDSLGDTQVTVLEHDRYSGRTQPDCNRHVAHAHPQPCGPLISARVLHQVSGRPRA